MINVCLISPDSVADAGGIEWSQQRIAGFLTDFGYTVDLIQLSPFISPQHQKEKKHTITAKEPINHKIQVYEITPWISKSGTDFAWQEVLQNLQILIRKKNYHIFHGLSISYSGFSVISVAKQHNKPVIVSCRGSDINRNIYSSANFSHIQWSLKHADWITFVSAIMQKKAEILDPSIGVKSNIIYNSSHLKYFDTSAIIDFNLPPEWQQKQIIGASGTLGPKKGWDILIKAFVELLKIDDRYRLLWIGPVTAGSGRYSQYIPSLIESGKMMITGIIPHHLIITYLKLLNVFVLTSPDEGCPNSLLEAILAKIPIISTNVGAVPEIIRNQIEGILVYPFDVENLINAIVDISNDHVKRSDLIYAAYKRLEMNFSEDTEREAWLTTYQGLI